MGRKDVELLIKNNLDKLTRQQIKTLRGQLNIGDIEAASKGLKKILGKYNNSKKQSA